ncbi:MAG: hypothetical protein ACK42C_06490, partial [Aquificaceae bacterium]
MRLDTRALQLSLFFNSLAFVLIFFMLRFDASQITQVELELYYTPPNIKHPEYDNLGEEVRNITHRGQSQKAKGDTGGHTPAKADSFQQQVEEKLQKTPTSEELLSKAEAKEQSTPAEAHEKTPQKSASSEEGHKSTRQETQVGAVAHGKVGSGGAEVGAEPSGSG